jgi:hypothetical protein
MRLDTGIKELRYSRRSGRDTVFYRTTPSDFASGVRQLGRTWVWSGHEFSIGKVTTKLVTTPPCASRVASRCSPQGLKVGVGHVTGHIRAAAFGVFAARLSSTLRFRPEGSSPKSAASAFNIWGRTADGSTPATRRSVVNELSSPAGLVVMVTNFH